MRIGPQRPVNPDAIVAPQGYRVEALITGLTFPTAISFGPGGELYLAESGGYPLSGAAAVTALPRVLRVDPDSAIREIGRVDNPISGLVYRNGELFIGEEGPSPRILRVTAEGEVQIPVDGLPGGGDYGLSGLALSADGGLVFGLGSRTNSGVVGLDNVARGWVAQRPELADVPGADIELAGVNYVTGHPASGGAGRATTGAFKPFGRRSEPDETVRSAPRSSGTLYRMALDTGKLERLAWGFRNPVGVACGPDGRLFTTEGGMEERGSRPIAGAPDSLWEVQSGGYYGWPDHSAGLPITDPRFRLPGHPQPRRLLKNGPKVVGVPRATFAPRSGVGRLDFSTSEAFGFAGQAFVALSGAWSAPAYPGESGPQGFRVVRVDPRSGETTNFLANRNGAPASAGNNGGLERPFDVRFDPSGEVLYVVDLGEIHLNHEAGLEYFGGTGIVWRITRSRPMLLVTTAADETERDAADETVEDDEAEESAAEEDEPEAFTAEDAPFGETAEQPTDEDGSLADGDGTPDTADTAEEPLASREDTLDDHELPTGADTVAQAPDDAEETGALPGLGDETLATEPEAVSPTAAASEDIVPEIDEPATPVVETVEEAAPEESAAAAVEPAAEPEPQAADSTSTAMVPGDTPETATADADRDAEAEVEPLAEAAEPPARATGRGRRSEAPREPVPEPAAEVQPPTVEEPKLENWE